MSFAEVKSHTDEGPGGASVVFGKTDSFRDFAKHLAHYLWGRGYVQYPASYLESHSAEQAFKEQWGEAPRKACGILCDILAEFSPVLFYSCGKWAEVLGPVLPIVDVPQEKMARFTRLLKAAAGKMPYRFRRYGTLYALAYVSDVHKDTVVHPSGGWRLKGLTPINVRPLFFVNHHHRLHFKGALPYPQHELELQAFGRWSGYFYPDAGKSGGELIILKAPAWNHIETLSALVQSLQSPINISYNELSPAQDITLRLPELLQRHKHTMLMEGFGEFEVSSEATGTRILSSTYHEIFIISPKPRQKEIINELGYAETRSIYQRTGRLMEGMVQPGIKVFRERFKSKSFFTDFLNDFGLSITIPPGH